METQTAKTSSKNFWKQPRFFFFFIEADLYEVTINYFTACRDSLQVAATCVLQTHYTAWRSKRETNQHRLCPQRADHESNNASLCYIFTLVKTPGSWHLASQCCSTSFSHNLTHISKIFGDCALYNFAASAGTHLLRRQAWSQNI